MMLFNLYLVHILLKKPWLKYLQLSLVLLPIVSMYWAETKSIQHVLPFVLIIYASLIYVHRKDSISLAVLLIISFITIASLPLINSYQLTYALWGVIGFGLFIVKKEDFVKNQLAIFTCLFCWIIFTVGFSGSGGGTSSYYIGVLMAVCFSLKAKETGGLGLYVYSAPFILTVSPTTAPLVVMVKKIPIGGLIISASFAIFAIGFVLNILKAKKLNSH
jgi:hypothetical protein